MNGERANLPMHAILRDEMIRHASAVKVFFVKYLCNPGNMVLQGGMLYAQLWMMGAIQIDSCCKALLD